MVAAGSDAVGVTTGCAVVGVLSGTTPVQPWRGPRYSVSGILRTADVLLSVCDLRRQGGRSPD